MMKIYKRWDWENDKGIELISNHDMLPEEYVIVNFDYRNLIYRIVEKVKTNIIDDNSIETWTYDYYYDDMKRLVEKRSLDESGNVSLIVHYVYKNGIRVEEIGWNPDSEEPPKRSKLA
jgi:hypothetical protein